jgi:hypothetical protein
MSERTVIARSCQICDICHHRIEAGERCRLIRDDFWPEQIWFEHLRCPGEAPVTDVPGKSFLSIPKTASAY